MVSPICFRCGQPIAYGHGYQPDGPEAPQPPQMHMTCSDERQSQPPESAHWILRVLDWFDGDAGDRFVALVCAFSAGAVCALVLVGML